MSGINFKGVEEAKESVMTPPGTIDVFKISEVKFDTSTKKGTYYMGVTFSRKQDSFNHSFYLSEKALPRVKSLVKHAVGALLDDTVLEEKLIAMLKGKELACKVTAKIDEENGRVYADLSFGGFCKAPALIGELAFTDKESAEIEKGKKVREANASAKPDAGEAVVAPTAEEPLSASGPATPGTEEEVF